MDSSQWRFRVALEPRGFIRLLEVVLAIVAFATTAGFSETACVTYKCGESDESSCAPISYPFKLSASNNPLKMCNASKETFKLNGDLSPSAQWFMFVGVTAFLYSLAAIVFYIVFDASLRLTHDRVVTITDLGITVLYTFLWLTAASAWAWGLGQIKTWSGEKEFIRNEPLNAFCDEPKKCQYTGANFSSLNASVAFAFLNFFLWACNVWFVYKETPYHHEPNKAGDDGGGFVDHGMPRNNM